MNLGALANLSFFGLRWQGFSKKLAVQKQEAKPTAKKRSYHAAKIDRLNEDFLASHASINADILAASTALVGRSRTACQNDDIYIRLKKLFKKHVVGPQGFALISQVKDENGGQDKGAIKKIEDAWKIFGQHKYFLSNKKMNAYAYYLSAADTWFRDGEVFLRIIRGFDNDFGITFQPIKCEFFDVNYNEELKDGGYISSSIEFNKYDQVVAYWANKPTAKTNQISYYATSSEKIRYSANEIIHFFEAEDPDQIRGVPINQQTLLKLHYLDSLNESELIAYRAASCKMGFLNTPPGEGAYDGEDTDEDGNTISDFSPGTIEDIGQRNFTPYEPEHKSADHAQLTKTILRAVAGSSDVSYSSLSNDFSDLNDTTNRREIIDERDAAKMKQRLMIDGLISKMFMAWLPLAIMNGQIKLTFSKLRKFEDHDFRGRAWDWIKPKEDMETAQIAITNLLDDRHNIVSTQTNRDFNDVIAAQKEEIALAKAAEIPLFNLGGTLDHNLGAAS